MNTVKKALYQDLTQTVNQAIGRKAISVQLLMKTVEEARMIRQMRGLFALITYLNQMADQVFTAEEMDILKAHPRRKELVNRIADHLIKEKVITFTESLMLKRMLS
ncbi:hypothetical protein SAMN05444487_10188 [Marininema mesophilum]|uniref:Uncharacterized protein n=1 Tax=Marininema mesophilum TaxID=1048340 RepID=A0A1H2Q3D5_9BACL|nr:hypothetical protein [Marininema mesophilum]SDW01621.1 hypothetical protein SAMN05444487_10188 [Marininema mesophilum]